MYRQQRQRLTCVSTRMRMIVLIIGFLCFMAGIMPGKALAVYYTFLPTDDVHVDTFSPNGSNPIKYYFYTNGEVAPAHAYLKFYLGSVPATDQITEAILNLYCVYGYKTEVDLYYISDDSWDEGSVSWNNQPDSGNLGPMLDSAYVVYPYNWVILDLFGSGAWDPTVDETDNYISLLIKSSEKYLFFLSKDAAYDLKPFLAVTTTTAVPMAGVETVTTMSSVPIPPSCWLLGSGMVFFVRSRFLTHKSIS